MSYPPQPSLPPAGYNPQYQFWPQYFAPPEALLAPARRAGWMLIIIGVLLLLLGALIAIGASQTDDAMYADVITKMKAQNPNVDTSMMTPSLYRGMFVGFGVIVCVVGLVIGLIGPFVRGGSMAAAVVGLLALAVPLLGIVLMVLSSLIMNPAEGVMLLILLAIPVAVLITAATFLFRVIKNAPLVAQSRQQLAMMQQQQMMQAQYGQQQYGQQPYGSPGYGPSAYGAPTAGYAPPPPPPPTGTEPPATPPPAGG